MNRLPHLCLLVLITTGLSGCAIPSTTKLDYSNLSSLEKTVDEGKALVYFLRPNPFGWPHHSPVYDNGNFIGFVPYNAKLAYSASPGEHLFMVTGESADFLKADLVEGKTYYIQVQPRMGVWFTRFSLTPVTKENIGSSQVQEWLANAKPVVNNDAAFKWAEDNREDELQKKEEYFVQWMEKPVDRRPYLRPEDGI